MTRMKRVELDSGCKVIDDDDLTEMRLTCMHWEKMRKQSGLVMNDKERIAQLEMSHSEHARQLYELERKVRLYVIADSILAIVLSACVIIGLFAR